jgi:hypothetical protein
MAIAPTVKNRGAGRPARCESVRGPIKCGLFCFAARSLSVLYWFMGKVVGHCRKSVFLQFSLTMNAECCRPKLRTAFNKSSLFR